MHADINHYPASTFWLKIGSSCPSNHQHFTQFNISVQVCLKFGLLFDHHGSAVCPMWWCWRAYSDGHVRSHNSGSQHWNSYFLTLVDLTLILFTIYSDFTQSFTLNDYHVDAGIGTEIFFFHIYLARVSRLMSKSFDILCISPASTKQKRQQDYKVRAFYC